MPDKKNKFMKTFKTSRDIPSLPVNIFAAFNDPVRFAKWWVPPASQIPFNSFNLNAVGNGHS